MKTLFVKMLGLYLDVLSLIFPGAAGRKGFLLFCRPFRMPLTQKQNEFLNSAEKFIVTHQGIAVQGYRWGTGPGKILFLHGWQSHTYRWKAYVEAIPKDEYTVLALDAPGHGLSSGNYLTVPLYSSLIEDFIRQHGKFDTVVAHSLGGFSLLYTFQRIQLPVNRIILMAPPGEARDFIAAFQKALGISDRTMQLVIDHFATRFGVRPDFFSTQKFAGSLKVKGLIIHDEDDAQAPYEYSIPLQKSWPQSRLVTTKGLGHNLRSFSIVKQVLDFIEEPNLEPVLRD